MDRYPQKAAVAGEEIKAGDREGQAVKAIALWKGDETAHDKADDSALLDIIPVPGIDPLAGWYKLATASEAYLHPPKRHRGRS